jgi:hypothetical protein
LRTPIPLIYIIEPDIDDKDDDNNDNNNDDNKGAVLRGGRDDKRMGF